MPLLSLSLLSPSLLLRPILRHLANGDQDLRWTVEVTSGRLRGLQDSSQGLHARVVDAKAAEGRL